MTPESLDLVGEAAWRTAVAKVLGGDDFDARLVSRTADGIPVQPLYPASNGSAPAGARPPARIFARLDAAEIDPLEDVENGADGLALVFVGADAARGFGLDLSGLGTPLAGIELDLLPLRLESAPFASFDALRALLVAAEERHLSASTLEVDVGLDPIGGMTRSSEAPMAWPALGTHIAEAVDVACDHGFNGRLLRADGRPHHEAGATEAQELAAVVATGVTYLRLLDRSGTLPGNAREFLSFTLTTDTDLFLSVAKLRALRRLWARIEMDCGLEPRPLRLHAETSWRMLAQRDPPTNLLRNALACAGALLGDADSVAVLPHTAPLGLADPLSRRLARNTALVLRDEAGLDRVADAGAGSGTVEALTEALCAEAWKLLQGLERTGGLPMALTDGSWAASLAVARERRAMELKAGTRRILGTNLHPLAEEAPQSVLRRAPVSLGRRQDVLPSLRDDQLHGETA